MAPAKYRDTGRKGRQTPPVKKIFGNLSKTESVIVGLDLQPTR
jgi:hypothetical protein